MTTDTTYLLGHDAAELARLEHQARMLAPATRTVLQLAGIAAGPAPLARRGPPGDADLA